MEVDSVEQRAGDFGLIVLGAARGAAAGAAGVVQIAAAAGVHGGDQLDAGRVGDMGVGAGDQGGSGFERLAQRLQGASREFRQFI